MSFSTDSGEGESNALTCKKDVAKILLFHIGIHIAHCILALAMAGVNKPKTTRTLLCYSLDKGLFTYYVSQKQGVPQSTKKFLKLLLLHI